MATNWSAGRMPLKHSTSSHVGGGLEWMSAIDNDAAHWEAKLCIAICVLLCTSFPVSISITTLGCEQLHVQHEFVNEIHYKRQFFNGDTVFLVLTIVSLFDRG